MAILATVTLPWVVTSDCAYAQGTTQRQARGWLGITMTERPGGVVVVDEVTPDSPAQTARLAPGDIIVRVNNTPVFSAREMSNLVGSQPPGSVVQLVVSRNGTTYTTSATLEPFPEGDQLPRKLFVGKLALAVADLVTMSGEPGPTLESFRGKVVVFEFWSSFCRACRHCTPTLNAWHRRYAKLGLHVVGIASEPATTVASSAPRFGIEYAAYADPEGTTSAAYRARALPTIVVVDRSGVVRDVATGYDPVRMREIETLVVSLLAQPTAVR